MTGFTHAPLEVRQLVAGYGKATVLDRIRLTMRPGETLGLIGLNGAGKTTLIKSILMLVQPRSGSVHLFGQSHLDPVSRSNLAYLPERFQPPHHFRGHDFVRLTLAFYRRRAERARTLALAEQLDLDPAVLERRVRGYSKGMAQKLGLLATLLTDLPLLILDEPMSGLDPRARARLKQTLASYRARGHAIFLSSHILADHDELCDRVAVLHEGRLGYVGSPATLKARQRAPTLESAFLAEIDCAAPAATAAVGP